MKELISKIREEVTENIKFSKDVKLTSLLKIKIEDLGVVKLSKKGNKKLNEILKKYKVEVIEKDKENLDGIGSIFEYNNAINEIAIFSIMNKHIEAIMDNLFEYKAKLFSYLNINIQSKLTRIYHECESLNAKNEFYISEYTSIMEHTKEKFETLRNG